MPGRVAVDVRIVQPVVGAGHGNGRHAPVGVVPEQGVTVAKTQVDAPVAGLGHGEDAAHDGLLAEGAGEELTRGGEVAKAVFLVVQQELSVAQRQQFHAGGEALPGVGAVAVDGREGHAVGPRRRVLVEDRPGGADGHDEGAPQAVGHDRARVSENARGGGQANGLHRAAARVVAVEDAVKILVGDDELPLLVLGDALDAAAAQGGAGTGVSGNAAEALAVEAVQAVLGRQPQEAVAPQVKVVDLGGTQAVVDGVVLQFLGADAGAEE